MDGGNPDEADGHLISPFMSNELLIPVNKILHMI
jgi:hypothetical protein